MKKTLSTILAIVMLLALAIPALAESGEAAAAEPGAYTDKTVGVFRSELTDETATVRYYADAGSIAYMSIADYYAVMLPGQSMTVTPAEDGKYTLTNPCGSADVLMALYSLITGNRECVLKYQNVLQEQNIDQRFLVDRNFDGKFDESDADVRYDLNFAVLAGRESYSCGNLFPSMMKDLGYMTLGERSGGGACTILELNTADGFFYHISAYQMRLTNAAGEVIDAGIVPDAELVKTDADGQQDYSDFYNLDLLSDLINEFYAEEGAA